MSTAHLLEVKDLQTQFPTRSGLVRAVDGVSFYLDRGELLGLVGESGCGKSITALSVMRLIAPPGKIVNGEILFDGKDLLKLSDAEMRQMRDEVTRNAAVLTESVRDNVRIVAAGVASVSAGLMAVSAKIDALER